MQYQSIEAIAKSKFINMGNEFTNNDGQNIVVIHLS